MFVAAKNYSVEWRFHEKSGESEYDEKNHEKIQMEKTSRSSPPEIIEFDCDFTKKMETMKIISKNDTLVGW